MKRFLLSTVILMACSSRTTPDPPQPIVQQRLRPAPMRFHPDLPMVGQEDGERCDVWDLVSGLYRGSITASECRRWASPRPPLSPALIAATPEETVEENVRREHPDAGELVWANSHDGRWVATARRYGHVARVWDARTHASVRVLALEGLLRSTAYIDDLMWTRTGQLVLLIPGDGPQLWNALDPKDGLDGALGRGPDRYESFWVDPAGRYLGFVARGYRKPYDVALAGVIGVSKERPKDLLFVERPWTNRRVGPVAWAERRPTVFLSQSRLSGALDLCGREAHAVMSLDPARGIRQWALELPRVLTTLAPSPDGRFALIGTDDGPPLDPCANEERPPSSDDWGPKLRLWEVEGDRRTDLFSTAIGAVAWAPTGERFAVATGGHVHVFEAEGAKLLVSWEGHEPLAFTPDGSSLAFGGSKGLGMRTLGSGAEHWLPESGTTAVAFGPHGVAALATDTEVALWDVASAVRRTSAPVRGTQRMAWSASGEAVLLWTRLGRAYLHRFDLPLPVELPAATAQDLVGWAEGGVVLVRGSDILRRLRWQGQWHELPGSPLDRSFFVDRGARWAVAAPDPDIFGEEYQVRRLSDGETLFLSEDRRRHPFASTGAFSLTPPHRLTFRLGTDVLRAPLVPAAEATFAAPVRDLGERFASGEHGIAASLPR